MLREMFIYKTTLQVSNRTSKACDQSASKPARKIELACAATIMALPRGKENFVRLTQTPHRYPPPFPGYVPFLKHSWKEKPNRDGDAFVIS